MKNTRIKQILYSFPCKDCPANVAVIFYKSGYHKNVKFCYGQRLPLSAVKFVMSSSTKEYAHTLKDGTLSILIYEEGV